VYASISFANVIELEPNFRVANGIKAIMFEELVIIVGEAAAIGAIV
jgi:hypothetical protein